MTLPFWVLADLKLHGPLWDWEKGEKTEKNAEPINPNPPELSGPDRLCNVFGSVLASYFGGGNPLTDVYSWQILSPTNQTLFTGSGGAGFQTINFTFSQNGPHQLVLKVFRGGILIGNFSKTVDMVAGPIIFLKSSYELCESQELEISTISPASSNFSGYTFVWSDENGNEIGNSNSLKISKPGKYGVKFFFTNSLGQPECLTTLETTVSLLKTFAINPNVSTICVGQTLSFQSSPQTFGQWFLQKKGSSTVIPLGLGSSKFLNSGTFSQGFGEYEIILKTTNQNNPTCSPEARSTIFFNIEPQVKIISTKSATDCISPDGKLILEALTDLESIKIKDSNNSQGPFKAGDIIEIGNLESGAYTLEVFLNGCGNSLGAAVPLETIPPSLDYEVLNIEGESCTETGKINGSFDVKLKNGPLEGSFQILNEKGDLVLKDALPTSDELKISLSGGKYWFEILDKDSCNFPKKELIEIPAKFQTFFLVPEQLNICQSLEFIPQTAQSLTFTLTYPDGTKETKPAGTPFILSKKGEHSLVGILANQTDICPTTAKFNVSLINPIEYEPKLIEQDCFGNRTYEADIKGVDPSTVKFQWFNEKNQLVGTGQFLNPVSIGKFKLDVQPLNSSACPIPPKEFEITDPILSVDVTMSSTKLCEFGPRAILNLSTTFAEEITDVEWRRYDELGVIEALPQFKNQYQIIVDEEGVYEAAVFSRIPSINKNCELGRNTLKIDLIPEKIEFSIPGDLSICDPYQLVPQGTIPLEYTLTFPDGKVETNPSGEAFTLDQAGTYTLLGIDIDPKGPKCPEQKTFEVKINQPVQFQPILQTLNCDGSYDYLAKVDNYPPDQVDYYWKDQSGNLLGSAAVFNTSTYGSFTLEVQPKGSIPCVIDPVGFEVAVPVLKVDVNLVAEPLCPDQPNAALRAEADFTQVAFIEWWYTDINNTRSQLTAENNKKEILASLEGTYEVILKNSFNCSLGIDQVLILRSADQVRPTLKENYLVCPNLAIGPTLSPGQFANYEWYFEGNLVSSSPTFKPVQVGNYQIVVQSQEGCVYQATFTTQEECELKLRLPSAMQPENPEKPFLIYTNYLVDELELWIFNKWGNLIFYCENSSLIDQESTCLWDGTYQGQKVPPGAYSYRINYKNLEKNIQKVQLGAVLILD